MFFTNSLKPELNTGFKLTNNSYMLLDLTCWLWYNITSSPIFLLVECWMLMSHESWVISHKLYLVYTLVSNYWVSKWNFYLEFVHNFVKTISTTSIEDAQRLYTRQVSYIYCTAQWVIAHSVFSDKRHKQSKTNLRHAISHSFFVQIEPKFNRFFHGLLYH